MSKLTIHISTSFIVKTFPYHALKWENQALRFTILFDFTVSKLNRQCNNTKP